MPPATLSNSQLSHRGLAPLCTTTKSAASPFAVFEGVSTTDFYNHGLRYHVHSSHTKPPRCVLSVKMSKQLPSLLRRRIFALYHHQFLANGVGRGWAIPPVPD